MEFDEDDWFFESVKAYDTLFMYELQTSTQVMCWTGEKICAVCHHQNQKKIKSELLMLQLPQKLSSEGDQGLSKDRDFRLAGGGFCDGQITSVQFVPTTGQLVTTETGQNCVRTWSVSDSGSGVITENQSYTNNTETSDSAVAAVSKETNKVAFGSHGNSISIVNLEDGLVTSGNHDQAKKDDSMLDRLCGISWFDAHTLWFCSRDTGQIWQRDVRENTPQARQITDKQHGVGPWSVDTSRDGMTMYVCSCDGRVTVLRKDGGRHLESVNKLCTGLQGHGTPLTVKCSPTHSGTFSLSGRARCLCVCL